MADTNINIYLRGIDDSSSAKPKDPGGEPDPTNPTKNKQDTDNFSVKTLGIYAAKQGFDLATARVGTLTRNTNLQNKVNTVLKLAGYAGAFMINPALGILTIGFDEISSQIDYSIRSRQEGIYLNIMNRRMGNINRSRE